MASDQFCSHFLQEGQIDLIPRPDCCIYIAVSGDTHIDAIWRHKSIWLYGHMTKIWLYGHIAIWLYGIKDGQYGCCRKKQYKFSNLAKELSRFDLPVRNESKNGPMPYFPLYFSEFPLYMQKMVATPQKCPKTHEIFFGGSWGIETATCTMSDANMNFGAFWDTLVYISKSKKIPLKK